MDDHDDHEDDAHTPKSKFELNGEMVTVAADLGERLSYSLRERLGARDVKIGCNAGDCGACTVLVDGDPVCACLMPTRQAEGCVVETLAGLVARDHVTKALGESFQNHQAAQCGICTPGMMVAATALLRETPAPTLENVRDALGGVLCRCTGYRKIIEAVIEAANPVPALAETAQIGVHSRRIDGRAKVEGAEAFGDDIAPKGTLEIRVIRSPHAHADFTLGDLKAYVSDNTGVHAVLCARDVPGRNAFGVIPSFVDQPVFAEKTARFRGEAVAAVVATPQAISRLDFDLFPVIWTPLVALKTVADATNDDAPLLHENRAGNVMCGGFVSCGDAKVALKRADVTVSGEFTSGFVEHAYIEPEAGFAEIVDGRIEIHACTQAPFMDLHSMAEILGRDPGDIRIIPTATGGGFGAKLDLSVQPYLALAALKTGKPVRIAYSRKESMQSTTKRHPSAILMSVGATRDGRLCGFDFSGDFNTGAYASWGPTVATRVPVHASGPYKISDYRAQSRGIHTHCPPAGAFRGFGVPQSAIAQECLFDELSEKLDMDALDFRVLNALENGQPTVCGQVFRQGVGIKPCLEALRPAWGTALKNCAAFNAENTTHKRGVGVAAGWYGCGNTSLPNPSTILCGVRANGTLVLHQGAMDIGQGANTVITQIFAAALGVSPACVTLVGADTDVTPDGGKTSASRQTYVSGNAARLTGAALRGQILKLANAGVDAQIIFENVGLRVSDKGQSRRLDPSRMAVDADGYVLRARETYDPPTKPLDENGQGAPYAQFGYAAHLVEVEVDIKLGLVKPLQFTAAHDVGRAINPLLVEGQVHGGIAQGLGMALMEEYLPGQTENLHDYLIPTIGDVPPIETLIIEEPDAHGPFGAKGLGEHVLIPTAPAILNAIAHATGVRIREVPATPARVRQALKEAGYD